MESEISERMRSLLKRTVVWDNHACMPLRPGDTAFLPQLERVRRAGVDLVSLNVSFDLMDPNDAIAMLASFRHWIRDNPEHYTLVNSADDIAASKSQGRLTIMFDIEGGNAVSRHPGLVEAFYRLGVRWMLFAYNKNNKLGGGCMDEDCGLTVYGRQIVREMERVGMVLCCSHVGRRTAREIMDYSRNPVIFSHSNCAAIYSHVRNISDDLIRGCAATGGVVNVNGVGLFLGEHPKGGVDNRTETVVRHIDHIVQLVGSAHVGLGLDYVFDVADLEEYVRSDPARFPPQADGPGGYRQVEPERIPLIAEELLKRGYREADVQGIMGHNNLRVARAVWEL